ncbi:MAG: DUF3108 domain-containing protein [Mucinivorans sp.]
MFRKTIIIAAIAALYCGSANAQHTKLLGCGDTIATERVAFDENEIVKYTVTYSASFIKAEVADITFSTTADKYMGRKCYKIEAVAVTRPFYAIFFPLNDVYTTWVSQQTLRPVKATSFQHEGDYRFRTALDFHYHNRIARTEGHDLRHNTTRRHTLVLNDCSYDALSLFYNLRSADLSTLQNGQSQSLSLVLEDTVRTVRFRFIKREIQKLSNIGSFRTVKFACQFATTNDEAFHDGAEFYIWLSDDDNRIPIYLESPIRVGKVYAKLNQWSGLKNPFSSIVIND